MGAYTALPAAVTPKTGPAGRAGLGAMTYDPDRARLILFGGEVAVSGRPWGQIGDTWVCVP